MKFSSKILHQVAAQRALIPQCERDILRDLGLCFEGIDIGVRVGIMRPRAVDLNGGRTCLPQLRSEFRSQDSLQ